MNPTVALLIGVILIGVVASGRARAVWDAMTGNTATSSSGQAGGLTPGTGSGGSVPGGNAGPTNPPGWG